MAATNTDGNKAEIEEAFTQMRDVIAKVEARLPSTDTAEVVLNCMEVLWTQLHHLGHYTGKPVDMLLLSCAALSALVRRLHE